MTSLRLNVLPEARALAHAERLSLARRANRQTEPHVTRIWWVDGISAPIVLVKFWHAVNH